MDIHPQQNKQILYMDNGYCVLDVCYGYGKIHFARTVAGGTVTVSKTLGLDIAGPNMCSVPLIVTIQIAVEIFTVHRNALRSLMMIQVCFD